MIPTISVNELSLKLQTPSEKPFLVDVREASELEICALPFDLHIPIGEIPSRYNEIPKDKDVVVYCKSGGRSGKVCTFLLENGFNAEMVKNLDGGMMQWAEEIDPATPTY